jgi:undecaprenyl-phosphate alpha-N-acetylglucosaminyl 1-phosphatetransferase
VEFFIVFFVTLITILILGFYSKNLKLLDVPSERKRHGEAVPLVGGLSIYCGMLMALALVDAPPKLSWLVASASVLVIVGALDDRTSLGIKPRFIAQFVATLLMMLGSDVWVSSLGVLDLKLDRLVGLAFTAFAVIGLTNAFNLADGIDGLASGYALIFLGILASGSVMFSGQVPHAKWLISFAVALTAFWVVNMSLVGIRRVFLGDAGSLLLGFVVSWILVYYSQRPVSAIPPVAVLWCVAVPVLDTLLVITNRVGSSKSPFQSDRSHLHYRLIDHGFSPRQSLAILLTGALIIGWFGLGVTLVTGSLVSVALFFFLYLGLVLQMILHRKICTERC